MQRRPLAPLLILLVLWSAAIGAGCSAPPKHRVGLAFGNVRGFEPHGLEDLAERFAEEREFVLGLLPGAEDRFVELWQLDHDSSEEFDRENVGGVTRQPLRGGFGLVRLLPGWMRHTRVLLGARTSDTTLTHELVHAYLGDEWRTLPPALEEGLADWIAMQQYTESKRRAEHLTVLLGSGPPIRLQRLQPWQFDIGRLEHEVPQPDDPLSPAAVLALEDASPWNRAELIDTVWVYAMGHYLAERIVERVGLAGLHELALEATREGRRQIPSERILSAAGLEEDGLDRADLARRQTEAMLRSALQEPPLLSMLQKLFVGSSRRGESIERCFLRIGAALRVGSSEPVLITELPGFDRAVRALEASLLLARGEPLRSSTVPDTMRAPPRGLVLGSQTLE